jgi:hypothetical protein
MFAALNSFQVGGKPTFVSDVFSTSLYTGNGSTQTITNGIDLSTKGGLVWIKDRVFAYNNALIDTARGATKVINSNLTNAESTIAQSLTAFNSNGFSVGSNGLVNTNINSDTYVSWTFRKQQKFFDIVTYIGNGSTGLQIPHNLGSVPGCIMIKRTDSTSDWAVYHRMLNGGSGPEDYKIFLNTTAAQAGSSPYIVSSVSSTNFTLGGDGSGGGSTLTNVNSATYVAYIFAHNAGGFGQTGTDNVISCGSTNGSKVTLGYQPQWILYKSSDFSEFWQVVDSQRGMPAASPAQLLKPNTSDAETTTTNNITIESDGFTLGAVTGTVIYIAIKAS